MKEDLKDFIGVFHNVYEEGFCQHLISEFERLQSSGAGFDRKQTDSVENHIKDDHQIYANCRNVVFNKFKENALETQDIFYHGLQKCYDVYCDKFSVLKNDDIRCKSMKLQKTNPGQGYHVWHCEQGNDTLNNRCLAYMLYLNTLPPENCGETEFLYQQRRIAPIQNTILIWPASFTHAHRGNPVYGKASKYIVTGWFYYE